jgi:hypothetical protein
MTSLPASTLERKPPTRRAKPLPRYTGPYRAVSRALCGPGQFWYRATHRCGCVSRNLATSAASRDAMRTWIGMRPCAEHYTPEERATVQARLRRLEEEANR